ncbi:MAG: beta-propeller domain-containing protein [Candidatus Thiodiazotropha sp.]
MPKQTIGAIFTALFCLLAILLSGCNSSTSNGDNNVSQNDLQLKQFDTCDELKSYLIDTNDRQNALVNIAQTAPDDALESAPTTLVGVSSGAPVSQPGIETVSGTNNQVVGVDEADFVKTSGDHTYILSGGNLVILQTWPAVQSQELSRTEIDGYPRALFFDDDVVWVVSDLTPAIYPLYDVSLAADIAPRIGQMTKVSLFDVADPGQPSLIRETVFESRYVDARRIDQQVYLIVTAQLDLNPVLDDPTSVDIDDLLPILSDNRDPATNSLPTTAPICECEAIYRPDIANGTGTLTILGFDLANPQAEISSQTILGNSGMVYANEDHLYIASVEDMYWLWLPVMEGEAYPKPGTTIHKFSLQSTPRYLASGRVDGHLINQFAMDEYQGLLRVVTTEQAWWLRADPENRLYIMEQTAGELLPRTKLESLGKPGESLFAVRFDGERGYLVTFEQIDPLITLDLSDADNPSVAGELEVPGFSTYLHPIEGDMILAVGIDTDTWGIKLSLFDIGDFSAPALMSEHLIGAGSYTEAAYDHHAFTWFEEEKMLAIPVTQWNAPVTLPAFDSGDIFNGLELFRVTATQGIEPYAAIDHDIFYQEQNSGNWFYPEGIRRSFFVSDEAMNSYIYSISGRGLLVNDLATPAVNLAAVELPADNNDYLYIASPAF